MKKMRLKEDINNPVDIIKMDVPLFIRLLEYAKEDAKTDMDLHNVTEVAIKLSSNDKILTMKNYDNIIGNNNVDEIKKIKLSKFIK